MYKAKHYFLRLCLLAGLLCLLLTGCLGKPQGGTLTKKAFEALDEKQYNDALNLFMQAVQSGEEIVPALRGEGIALMALARYEEAAQVLEETLTYTDNRMPDTIRDIRLYLVSALYRCGQYKEAASVCEDLLETKDVPEGFYYLGASYLALNEDALAKENFDKAAALLPRDYSLYLQIYSLYEARNLTAVGDEYLQTALKIQPQTTQDSYHIGEIYYYLGRYDDARKALTGCVEEKYLPALSLMGEIYLAQGDYAHAMAMYETIHEENGETPLVYNGLAQCALAADDIDQALKYIGQGLALNEEEGKQQLRFNEIIAYERKLDFSTALVKAEAYMALYPSDEAGQKELKFLSTRGR